MQMKASRFNVVSLVLSMLSILGCDNSEVK